MYLLVIEIVESVLYIRFAYDRELCFVQVIPLSRLRLISKLWNEKSHRYVSYHAFLHLLRLRLIDRNTQVLGKRLRLGCRDC